MAGLNGCNDLLLLPPFHSKIGSLTAISLAFFSHSFHESNIIEGLDMLHKPHHAGQPLFTPCVRSHCTPFNVGRGGDKRPLFALSPSPPHSKGLDKLSWLVRVTKDPIIWFGLNIWSPRGYLDIWRGICFHCCSAGAAEWF